jgi:hypothetical protein
MRGVSFLLMGLCWLPSWTWAGSSECTSSGCTTSVSVSFKIVIPPQPLSTRQSSTLFGLATKAVQSIEAKSDDEQRSQIIGPDGTTYIPVDEGTGITYTL